jgi:hypothetical protein
MRDYMTRENATRALELASYIADLSGNAQAKKAATVATDINKITGGKYSTKKFAKDFRNVQGLIGTKQQRRRIGDAGTDKLVGKIAGSVLALVGRDIATPNCKRRWLARWHNQRPAPGHRLGDGRLFRVQGGHVDGHSTFCTGRTWCQRVLQPESVNGFAFLVDKCIIFCWRRP